MKLEEHDLKNIREAVGLLNPFSLMNQLDPLDSFVNVVAFSSA